MTAATLSLSALFNMLLLNTRKTSAYMFSVQTSAYIQ
jgi:hypothetical protein